MRRSALAGTFGRSGFSSFARCDWEPTARTTRYKVRARVGGPDAEFETVAEVYEPHAELTFGPGQTVAVQGHRHLPEISQGLNRVTGNKVGLTFVPHLMPAIRGIHATLYARLTKEVDVQALYEKRYASEPFVDVLPPGSHPDTRSVRGANDCRIAVHRPGRGDTVVILSVIDNLVKGAAGQAVQNMNLMFGWPETMGIEHIPLLP